jgi:hypothetical protein
VVIGLPGLCPAFGPGGICAYSADPQLTMAIPSKAQSIAFFIRQNSPVILRQAPLATNSAAVETGALDVFIISTIALSFLIILDGFIVGQPSVPFFRPTAETPRQARSFRLRHNKKYWN